MTFEENVQGVLFGVWQWPPERPCDYSQAWTEALFAMPEMQAIKSALYRYITHRIWAAPPDMTAGDLKTDIGLPEHVVKWVFG